MRLQFGNPDSLQLVEQAPTILAEHAALTKPFWRIRTRVWWKTGAKCAICEAALQRDELLIKVGRRSIHEGCYVSRLVELRRKLTALGYRIAGGGGIR